ncbi:kinase mkl2 MAPK-like protein [Blomia tropicalis]|nr:kinase mkl2 MAPK-like protein [Blomia tropicalis]
MMNDDSSITSPPTNSEPNRSPQSVVDCASLANCMGKNKESLKVKLMLRRPIDVLVDQGILPRTFSLLMSPKSSPSFYEQKLKLERAKTGDFLKHKIQRRPQRDELVQQHILEDSFDPSYYEQERKLKKARLADDLNERLSQRPGPLELIKGNILHTDETIEQAIKEGQITFKKTCEGEVIKNPPKRFVFEEESSSDSAPSPHQANIINCTVGTSQPNVPHNLQLNNSFIVTNGSNLIIPQASDHSGIVSSTSNVLNTNLSYIVTSPNILPTTTSTTVFIANDNDKATCLNVTAHVPNNVASVTNSNLAQESDPITFGPISNIAIQQGPPNVKKQLNSSQQDAETSYELLLKQQQMFLQWQLECQQQQKYPQISSQNEEDNDLLHNEISTSSDMIAQSDNDKNTSKREESASLSPLLQCNTIAMNGNFQLNQSTLKSDDSMSVDGAQSNNMSLDTTVPCLNLNNQSTKQYAPIVKKIISKLEDMKVSDLKAELKRRNLPVSGPKQQLIERLKPFSDTVVSNNNSLVTAELNGTTTIFNLNDCKNGTQLNNSDILNGSFTMGSPMTNSTTFILKNNLHNDGKKGLNDDLVLISNNDNTISTIPLQLKQPNPITLEAPTLTFPITNTFIPQYQIVSSTPTENKINLNGINLTAPGSIQTPIANKILVNNKLNILNTQPSIISTNLNYNQATNSIGKNSNLTFLASEPIQLGQIKNGLSFNITQPVPNIANKIVGIQNPGPVIHQLLLYPTTLNSTQDMSATNGQQTLTKQRSNSLPSESFHQLQRNTSLPIVINQNPVSQVSTDVSSNLKNVSSKGFVNIANILPQQSFTINQKDIKKSYVSNDNLPNSSTENNNVSCLNKSKPNTTKSTMNRAKSSKSVFTNVSTSTISSTDFNESPKLPEIKEVPMDDKANQIQPDSTTNSNCLDLDFILNFDELNDVPIELNENFMTKPDEKMSMDMNFDSKYKNEDGTKQNGMIDFPDNWFDSVFGQTSTEMAVDQMMESETNTPTYNASFLETINQIFDQNNVSCSKSGDFGNDIMKSDFTKHDPVLSNGFMGQATSTNFCQLIIDTICESAMPL